MKDLRIKSPRDLLETLVFLAIWPIPKYKYLQFRTSPRINNFWQTGFSYIQSGGWRCHCSVISVTLIKLFVWDINWWTECSFSCSEIEGSKWLTVLGELSSFLLLEIGFTVDRKTLSSFICCGWLCSWLCPFDWFPPGSCLLPDHCWCLKACFMLLLFSPLSAAL